MDSSFHPWWSSISSVNTNSQFHTWLIPKYGCIILHNSQKEIYLRMQKREHLFSHLVVVLRHPCCDQVFDLDVQMKKDKLVMTKLLQSKDSPHSLHLIPCGREKCTSERWISWYKMWIYCLPLLILRDINMLSKKHYFSNSYHHLSPGTAKPFILLM